MSSVNDNRTLAVTSINTFILLGLGIYQFNKNKETAETVDKLQEVVKRCSLTLEKMQTENKLKDESFDTIKMEFRQIKQELSEISRLGNNQIQEDERYRYPNSFNNSFNRSFESRDLRREERPTEIGRGMDMTRPIEMGTVREMGRPIEMGAVREMGRGMDVTARDRQNYRGGERNELYEVPRYDRYEGQSRQQELIRQQDMTRQPDLRQYDNNYRQNADPRQLDYIRQEPRQVQNVEVLRNDVSRNERQNIEVPRQTQNVGNFQVQEDDDEDLSDLLD